MTNSHDVDKAKFLNLIQFETYNTLNLNLDTKVLDNLSKQID